MCKGNFLLYILDKGVDNMHSYVTIEDLVNHLPLHFYAEENYLDRKVKTGDISRPGLELTGYFRYYPQDRLQLFGKKEVTYLEQMTSDERYIIMDRLATEETPAFVFSKSLIPCPELIEVAEKKHIPILQTNLTTSKISGLLSNYIEDYLAKRESIHGVLVDIHGLGVLIQGDSGIGKSETALELIKKGHRLVADDRVDVFRRDEGTLMGEAPKILEHLMEIRGIGIINILDLFGASAVLDSSEVQLVISLEHWTKDKKFERLGVVQEYIDLAGVSLPKITIPVSMGRNVAIIVEVAAMNFRAKTMGLDATKTFEDNLSRLISENKHE